MKCGRKNNIPPTMRDEYEIKCIEYHDIPMKSIF